MRGMKIAGFAAGLAALVLAGAALVSGGGIRGSQDHEREIRMVARDMTFYLEGESEPNPALRVRRGERIRLVLRNEDVGMNHDLAIEAWNVSTKLLEGRGEATLRFQVSQVSGPQEYHCTPHAQMMRGAVIVE